MDFVKRHAEATIKRFAKSFPSVLVTGARQTGKTTLLHENDNGLTSREIAVKMFGNQTQDAFLRSLIG